MTNFARNSAPVLAKILAKIQKKFKKFKNIQKNCSLVGIAKFCSLSETMEFSLASEISLS